MKRPPFIYRYFIVGAILVAPPILSSHYGSIYLGKENGVQKEFDFIANAVGLTLESRVLIKDVGRFQTKFDYVKVNEKNNQSYLPPETFEVYPIGISLRTNSRLTYSLNRSISMIISLNTKIKYQQNIG